MLTTLTPMGKFRYLASTGGYSLVEVIAAIAIFGIVAKTAIPSLDARRMRILTAQQMLAADLRLARANAITKSVHYRINFFAAGQIKLEPMTQQADGTWLVDSGNSKTLALPKNTQIATGSQCVSPCTPVVGTNIEFNSRGIPVNLSALAQITLIDDFGKSKALQAWPSGQVNEL